MGLINFLYYSFYQAGALVRRGSDLEMRAMGLFAFSVAFIVGGAMDAFQIPVFPDSVKHYKGWIIVICSFALVFAALSKKGMRGIISAYNEKMKDWDTIIGLMGLLIFLGSAYFFYYIETHKSH